MKTVNQKCTHCNGNGSTRCTTCNGTGRRRTIGISSTPEYDYDCLFCNGIGQRDCTWCNSRGYTERLVVERVDPTLRPNVSPYPTHIVQPRSRPLQLDEVKFTFTESSSQSADDSGLTVGLVIVCLAGAIVAIDNYGFDRAVVAAAGFFLVGGWIAIRTASVLGTPQSRHLERFWAFMCIGVGLCLGALAAQFLLESPEGQAITDWVVASTGRLVGALLGVIVSVGIDEAVFRKLMSS